MAEADPEMKPLEAPIIVERSFLVDGKKVKVQVTFPSRLGAAIGMENTYRCAQDIVLSIESAQASVRSLKRGQ